MRKFAEMNNKLNIMATTLNEAQLQILDMMSFIKSEETLNDLKKVISDFFAQQAQDEIDRLWENGELNETKVEGLENYTNVHLTNDEYCFRYKCITNGDFR